MQAHHSWPSLWSHLPALNKIPTQTFIQTIIFCKIPFLPSHEFEVESKSNSEAVSADIEKDEKGGGDKEDDEEEE